MAKRRIPVSDYIESLYDPQVPLDQLGLLIFARMQHRHIAIVLRNTIWTTCHDNKYEDIELTFAYLGGVQFSDTCRGPQGGGFPPTPAVKPHTKPRTRRRCISKRIKTGKLIRLIDTSKPHPRATKNSKKPLFCLDLDSVLSNNRKRLVKPKNLKEPNT